jgi:hypothetical protein
VNTSGVREHMEVVGSCGGRVGVVDSVEGGAIKLTRDAAAGGEHHYIPLDWVEAVGQTVRLRKPRDEVRRRWQADSDGVSG